MKQTNFSPIPGLFTGKIRLSFFRVLKYGVKHCTLYRGQALRKSSNEVMRHLIKL